VTLNLQSQTGSTSALRHDLKNELQRARRVTDKLFASLRSRALYDRPIPQRHRFVFYLGHLDTFDWNLLCRDIAGVPSRSTELETLFASGIDPLGMGPRDGVRDWPRIATVQAWNARLREQLDQMVDRLPFEGLLERGWALHACIEHRLMHAETLCYMLHQLPFTSKRLGIAPQGLTAPAPSNDWVTVPTGQATLGAPKNSARFRVWDNECDEHNVWVPKFRIQRYPVTNAAFLKFVQAGGYHERAFWSAEGWNWRAQSGIEHPTFWRNTSAGWCWRAMFTQVPLPLAWPVFVSHAEASAYARFANASLPSEAQWHRAAAGVTTASLTDAFEPSPVQAHPESRSSFGVHGLAGNGWNWTSTPFAPFPNFTPQPFYSRYSSDFFDGNHFVLKGASPRTDSRLVRGSFRNWFQPHYPYVYANFRCVESA
jgi:ergothioneine biosynthesis protein EgtB